MCRGVWPHEKDRGRGGRAWPAGLVFAMGMMLSPALGLAAEPAEAGRVSYQDGRLSVAFEETPVEVAFEAIRAATRIEVVFPAAVQGKTLTARVEGLGLEAALRRLLRALGLESFVLVYDGSGVIRRLIALEPGTGRPPPDPAGPRNLPLDSRSPAPETPVYIPPLSDPVYIPPTSEPVYIPPATPPQYIPPGEEPVYIPAAD